MFKRNSGPPKLERAKTGVIPKILGEIERPAAKLVLELGS